MRKSRNPFKGITANVVALGVVSFLTDISGEMIYPLLPLFVTQYIGASPAFLGLLEGAAESASALLKLFSGIISDRVKNRQLWILGGYSLSSLSRPLMGLAQLPWHVFLVRFSDRVGKGIRTSPRDALIADVTPPESRGKAYGFHRGMDHAGAVLGPIISTIILAFFLTDLRKLFLLAAIPAALSVLVIIFFVRETAKHKPLDSRISWRAFTKAPQGKLRVYLLILFIFLLSNASDAFILLRLTDLGLEPKLVPVFWAILNVVKALTAMPFSMLSDKMGRRKVILIGWSLYALIYAAFGLTSNPFIISALFVVYGCFYGFTEGTEDALMADLAPKGELGYAFGWYNFVLGISLLPANLLFGFLWQKTSASVAFLTAAAIAALSAFFLFIFIKRMPSAPSSKPVELE